MLKKILKYPSQPIIPWFAAKWALNSSSLDRKSGHHWTNQLIWFNNLVTLLKYASLLKWIIIAEKLGPTEKSTLKKGGGW